jgi:hypothetical protein
MNLISTHFGKVSKVNTAVINLVLVRLWTFFDGGFTFQISMIIEQKPTY